MTTKRIAAELSGDIAIKAEIIYVSTGLAKEAKKEADSIFFNLAVNCIEKIIDECRSATGVQYPSHSQIIAFVTGEATKTKNTDIAEQAGAKCD